MSVPHLNTADVELEQIEIPELGSVPTPTTDATFTQINQTLPRSGPGDFTFAQQRNPDEKPAEYALHILFTQFVRYSERKLNLLSSGRDERDIRIEGILGEGADPEFDKILLALAHVARRKPKGVIDSVMYWRKSKSEVAAAAQSTSEQLQAERNSLISIFILSRVLMEIVKRTPPEVLGDELSEKLEDIIFKQLVTADPHTIAVSSIRRANHTLFSRLLGDMSRFRFASVNDRFIGELEKLPANLNRAQQSRAEMLIQAIEYLKLKLYPEEYLEESANFLESISKFYRQTQNLSLRDSYAEVLSKLFEPIAEVADAELLHPLWAQTVETLYKPAVETMKRNWEPSFRLATMTLCVSPEPLFAENWLPLIESQYARQKGKWSSKFNSIFVALSKLLWVYSYRCNERLTSITRKIESVKKIVVGLNKKHWPLLSRQARKACMSILASSFHAYDQLTIDELMFPLLTGNTAAQMAKSHLVQHDMILAERSIIAVGAFIMAMKKVKGGNPSPFPSTKYLNSHDTSETLPSEHGSIPTAALGASVDLFGDCLSQILFILAQQLNYEPLSRQNSVSHFVVSSSNLPRNEESSIELMLLIIESFPWWASSPKHWEVLCRQVQSSSAAISAAAAESIRAIARNEDIRALMNVFSKSLFALDARFYASYDLPQHIELEPSLRLYVELTEIWVSRLQHSDAGIPQGGKDIVVNTLWSVMEEIEGNGLYFLCSQDREIRTLALRILWLTSEFEKAIDSYAETSFVAPSGRVIDFLEEAEVTDLVKRSVPRLELSMPERTRVSKFKSRKTTSIARLADSDYGVDSAIWLKLFPLLINICFEKYPIPVAICRNIVCTRLVQMHDVVVATVENETEGSGSIIIRHPMRVHADIVIEQWRIYLMVACISLTTTEEQKLHVPASYHAVGHGRKKSSQKITLHHQRITSARSIFKIITPLMGVNHPAIRDAIISGISCINVNTYKTMIECFQPTFQRWDQVLLNGQSSAGGHGNFSTGQRVVTEITHILKLTAHYLQRPQIQSDDWIRSEILHILDLIYGILMSNNVQTDYNFQSLRRYFCGLVEDVVTSLGPKSLTTAQQQKYFNIIEGWSSYGQYAATAAEREGLMRRSSVAIAKDAEEQNVILASIEFEKRKFDLATSRAMSALLFKPVADHQVNANLKWIYALLSTNQDALRDTGKNALKNLIMVNSTNQTLMKELITRSYSSSDQPREIGLQYFSSLVDVIVNKKPEIELSDPLELLALCIFKLGSRDSEVREQALSLVGALEDRLYGGQTISYYQYKVRSTTTTIIKREIFHLSGELAKARVDATYTIFSHLTQAFHYVNPADLRDLLGALLPWLQNIEFSAAPSATPSASLFENSMFDAGALMVLGNLFELTISFSEKIQYEIEALWVALCTGTSGPKNVDVIVDFLLGMCLVNRNPGIVRFSRRILAYLSGSAAEPLVVDRMIRYLEPRWMVSQTLKQADTAAAKAAYPYVVDLASLPMLSERGNGSSSSSLSSLPPLSYTQLAAIFLIDVSSSKEPLLPCIPTILHVCFTLLDHFVSIVQEAVAELLASIVGMLDPVSRPKILDFRKKVLGSSALRWYYDDMNLTAKSVGNITTPDNMVMIVRMTVGIASSALHDIEHDWAAEAIKWATTCPVRHVACRSFQIFRCLKVNVDQHMLADMLARLSSTISEAAPDIQGFAIQILMTLNAITDNIDPATLVRFPQLFWSAVASLGTTKEREYIEALSIMIKLLSKWDFNDEEALNALRSSFPSRWEGEFENLQPLIFLGLRSSNAYEISHEAIDLMSQIKPNELLTDPSFLPMALAANLPRFLHGMDTPSFKETLQRSANSLEQLCERQELEYSSQGVMPPVSLKGMSRILTSYVKGRFWSKQDFLQQYVSALCASFPESTSSVLILLMGTLSNKIGWVKTETMSILKLILPQADLHHDQRLSGLGADIVSPLLRLLQTEYSEQALDVLDEAGAIVAGQMDKHILRMSLGSKQLAKEYDKTSTLYGIPDDSGWSVPKPAITATVTRNNVHAVFYTCDTSISSGEDDVPIEFEFQGEDDFEYNGYGVPLTRSDSVSVNAGNFGNMDRMLTVLDDLDSFFTKATHPRRSDGRNSHGRKISNITESSTGESFAERNESISIPQIYDKKVSLILNRSLGRTPSSVSFRTSFADSFTPDRRRQNIGGSSLAMSTDDDEVMANMLRHEPSRSSSSSAGTSTLADTDNEYLAKQGKGKVEHAESSFRLESLLRGKRRGKQKDTRKSPEPPPFQFP